MTTEQIAQVAHEVNRAYCLSLGDESQTSWEDAPEWQKESAMNGVDFHLANPNAGADASHNNWMKEKVENGWKYGEVKDPENKLHPCIVPFEMLPKEQQAKDYLFRQVVHSLIDFVSKDEDVVKQEMTIQEYEEQLAEKYIGELNENRLEAGQTFGEKLVGLSFNPSGDQKVQRAKVLCAELADLLNDHYTSKESYPIEKTLYNHAVGEILNAQMNVVKVLTFK